LSKFLTFLPPHVFEASVGVDATGMSPLSLKSES